MTGCFVEVSKRRSLQANAGKKKVMVLGGEERSLCEILQAGRLLEPVTEFQYLGFVLDESGGRDGKDEGEEN